MALTRGVAQTFGIPMYDSSAPTTLKTGLTVTTQVSKDGGAFAATTNSAAELGTTGVYNLLLTASEMDAAALVVRATATGAVDQTVVIVTDPNVQTELTTYTAAKVSDVPTASTVASAVWAAGTRTLTSFGTLTTDTATAVWGAGSRTLTSLGTLVNDVASAVWSATGRTLSAFGFTVNTTKDADIAAIKAKTDLIGAAVVTVAAPTATNGEVHLYAADDYADTDSRAIEFRIAAAGVPDLTGATVKFKCAQATWTAVSCTKVGTDWVVKFEPTSTQTALLTVGRQAYELEATLASGRVITLATGMLITTKDIPAVT